MNLAEALKQAWSGRAVLFTGAGFSKGAINVRGNNLPSGSELATQLAAQIGLPTDTPLDDAADEFLRQNRHEALINELQKEFTVKSISSEHLEIAKVPWRRVFTTNYDNVLETSFAQAGKILKPVVLSDSPRDVVVDGTLCVHLNGYVGRLDRNTVSSQVKLSDTSYLTSTVEKSSWAVYFRQELIAAQAVFFVGYTAYDLDIRRLLFENQSLVNKTFFILGYPDAITTRRVSRFGTVLPLNTISFSDVVRRSTFTATDEDISEVLPFCLARYELPVTAGQASDPDIFKLFLYGRLRNDLVLDSLTGGSRYLTRRSSADRALKHFDSGTKAIAFYADLGNGKSITLDILKCLAHLQGFAVYTIVRRSESLFEELDQMLGRDGKKLLIIDNYPDWVDALEYVGSRRDDSTFLGLSARSGIHDVFVERLPLLLKIGEIEEISLDKLNRNELEDISAIFDQYGLWGDLSSWSPMRKYEFLAVRLRGEWHAILVQLLESPQILSKLEIVLEGIRLERNFYEVIISLFILNTIGYEVTIENLVDLCGSRVLDHSFRRDLAINELVDFNREEVLVKSSVLGEFILQRIVDPNVTLRTLIALVTAADLAAAASRYYFGIFVTLCRFRSLQRIFPEDEKERSILSFYEAIKTLPHCRNHPLFWLQYAIACTVYEQFERAEKYFAAAYSFAKDGREFDAFQIDNHFARFILVRATRTVDVANAMRVFRDFRRIVGAEIERERRDYPYRVGALLRDFYDALSKELVESHRSEIKRFAQHLRDRIDQLPEGRQSNRYVKECRDNMEKILGTAN